jgi:hypothetical protein
MACGSASPAYSPALYRLMTVTVEAVAYVAYNATTFRTTQQMYVQLVFTTVKSYHVVHVAHVIAIHGFGEGIIA